MKMPRDIVAIVIMENGREERLNLQGYSAESRFAHLRDAVRRWEDEWSAYHLRLPAYAVEAIRRFHEARREAAGQKRIKAGKLTAKKMKQKASANRRAVLSVYRAGYPEHIGLRDRVSYIARKTQLSPPTVRKYLPKSGKRKGGGAEGK